MDNPVIVTLVTLVIIVAVGSAAWFAARIDRSLGRFEKTHLPYIRLELAYRSTLLEALIDYALKEDKQALAETVKNARLRRDQADKSMRRNRLLNISETDK